MLKVIYDLRNNEMGDAIVAALGDISRKVDLAWTAIQFAKQADGTPASQAWRDKVADKLKAVYKSNNDRRMLAHSLLDPKPDGSVAFTNLQAKGGELRGTKPIEWSHHQFDDKTQAMETLATELADLQSELRQFRYVIS